MRFTLRQLEYFVATCDVGSVTVAALNIPVAQSSVSAAIAQLEAALGVQLLIRHHAQGVSPTPAGRQFLLRARALLRDADQLERFASELTKELSGTLDLGCLVTIAPLVLPRLCQAFQQQHHDVTIEMTEAGQEDLIEALRTGRLTITLMYDLDVPADLSFEPLQRLPPYALFAAEHPLAAQDEVTLAELAGEPLVLLDLPLSRDYFRELFIAAGLEPTVAQRSTYPEVIRTLVGNGFGYTIINARPLSHQALDGRHLSAVRIAEPARAMTIGLVTVSSMRPTRLTEAFAAHCRYMIARGHVPALRNHGANGSPSDRAATSTADSDDA